MTTYLEERAPEWVRRVPTDARTVTEVARDVIRGSGWRARSVDLDDHLAQRPALPDLD
jgi:hypothetical protein